MCGKIVIVNEPVLPLFLSLSLFFSLSPSSSVLFLPLSGAAAGLGSGSWCSSTAPPTHKSHLVSFPLSRSLPSLSLTHSLTHSLSTLSSLFLSLSLSQAEGLGPEMDVKDTIQIQ